MLTIRWRRHWNWEVLDLDREDHYQVRPDRSRMMILIDGFEWEKWRRNQIWLVWLICVFDRAKKKENVGGKKLSLLALPLFLSMISTSESCCYTEVSKIFRLDVRARAWWCSFVSEDRKTERLSLGFPFSLSSDFIVSDVSSFLSFLYSKNIPQLETTCNKMKCAASLMFQSFLRRLLRLLLLLLLLLLFLGLIVELLFCYSFLTSAR